jgi:hypothetical protein
VIVALVILTAFAFVQRDRAVANAVEAHRQSEIAERRRMQADSARENAVAIGRRRLILATLLLNPEGGSLSLSRVVRGGGLLFGISPWFQSAGSRSSGLYGLLTAFQVEEPDTFISILGGGDPAVAAGLISYVRQSRGGLTADGQPSDPAFDFGSEPWVSRFREAASSPALQRVQMNQLVKERPRFNRREGSRLCST